MSLYSFFKSFFKKSEDKATPAQEAIKAVKVEKVHEHICFKPEMKEVAKKIFQKRPRNPIVKSEKSEK